jgi:glucose-1-phosphate cytidylyltransferase
MLTYGDGVGNVPTRQLLAFHRSRRRAGDADGGRAAGAVRRARVRRRSHPHFKEKSTLHEGWINGGFSSSSRRR